MMPFDNEVSGSEMASLVALRRLVEIDPQMVNASRVLAEFSSGRAVRLAEAILSRAPGQSEEDAAALSMITRVAVV